MENKKLGDFGERIAEKYLQNRGYQILDRNYFFRIQKGPKKGEVDIVAKKNDIVIFVEVKTLKTLDSLISPAEKVNFSKQRKLRKTAESWLIKNKIPLDSKWQIDTLAVKVDFNSKKAKILHFQNISLV